MPDTVRSTDWFLNPSTGVFRDNSSGDIDAQDLRDFTLSTYRPQCLAGGRLTTEPGAPVSVTDRAGQATLYYVAYLHDGLGLYDGTGWALHTFAEPTLSLSGLVAGKNYDVFAYPSAGAVALEWGTAWTADTVRAEALGGRDGVPVKAADPSRRYLGTVRTSGAGTTDDTAARRFVWNNYNRVRSPLQVGDGTPSVTSPTTQAWAPYMGNTATRVHWVGGAWYGVAVSLRGYGRGSCTAASAVLRTGIGVDATAGSAASGGFHHVPAANVHGTMTCFLDARVTAGYHWAQLLEYPHNAPTTTFYGGESGGIIEGSAEC